ncbi:MAG: DUF222 domain-containing protein [Acidimicrobiia bacterium]
MFDHDVSVVGLSAEEAPKFGGLPVGVEPADRHVVPSDLEQIPPGPFLGAILSGVDRSKLSGHDTLRVMKARNRQIAHFQAELAADMVEVAHRTDADMGRSEEAWDYASDEIRAALTLTRRAAESELDFATDIYERFPQVFSALHVGRIDVRKAKAIIYGIAHLDIETAGLVVDQILEEASGLTTGQLRACLQRLCIEADPEEAAKRYEDRLAERRVESRSNPEGAANLYGLDLPPNKVAAIRGRIEVLARQLKRFGDPRTMDQLRADIYIDQLLGRHDQKISGGGVITMTASLETLAGLAEQAAEIPGLGPVISDIARQVLEDHLGVGLRYKITTPEGGVLIGTPSRTATTALRRFVETRDETCMGIGMPHGCHFL